MHDPQNMSPLTSEMLASIAARANQVAASTSFMHGGNQLNGPVSVSGAAAMGNGPPKGGGMLLRPTSGLDHLGDGGGGEAANMAGEMQQRAALLPFPMTINGGKWKVETHKYALNNTENIVL